MQEWLISLYAAHHYSIYALILALGFAEGPFVAMVCGAILALGFLNFWPVYAVLILGDLVGDTMWYYIGHRFGERFIGRFGKYFSITDMHILKIKNIFHKYKNKLLFFSKITNGLGFSAGVLFTAGMSRIPFWRFIGVNALGQLVWSGVLIATGFFFGNLYLKIDGIMGKLSVVVIFIVVLVAVLRYLKYLHNKINK
jgi:membrane protein DedA with SNARE-associated domain